MTTNDALLSKEQDERSRARIRSDIGTNFFVEAGAGSGKTTLLVDRMIAMVEGGIPIDRICAITFTRAAAAEFYRRFQEKLSKTSGDPRKDALRKNALKNLDLCFMGTIDAFCNLVISEHPTEAGVPANAALTEDMSAYYLREYTRIGRGEYGPALQAAAQRYRQIAGWQHQQLFLDNIGRFAGWRGHEVHIEERAADTLDACLGEKKDGLIKILRYLKEHPECLAEKSAAPSAARETLLKYSDPLFDPWDKDPEKVTGLLKTMRDLRIVPEYENRMEEISPAWETYFTPHYTRSRLSWYETVKEGDPFLYEAVQNLRFAEVAAFLRDAASAMEETLKKAGRLTFRDYLIFLRDMLKKDAAADGRLIRHISARHSYFLIDEFQDTNPVQAEIFFYLTAGQPQADWRACRPKPGTLFMVGDPKQSIYRFQSADVEAFERVKALFTGGVGEVLFLSRNFRSTEPLCSWFNHVFPTLLDGNTAYAPIPTDEKEAVSAAMSGVFRYEVRYARGKQDRSEYDDTAALIDWLVRDPAVTIQAARTGSVPHPVGYGDIMLVTPAKTNMILYMQALSARRIPYFVEGAVDFARCPALKELILLLAAAADPWDKTARFAAEKLGCCRPSAERLDGYAALAKTVTPAALAALLLDAEQVFAHAGTENAELVYFALELLRQAQADGTVSSAGEAAAFLRTLPEAGSAPERYPQLIQSEGRVHLANLHKVKGLEAPVVILADPQQKPSLGPSFRVDHSGQTPQAYPFTIGSAGKSPFRKSFSTMAFANEREAEITALEKEQKRLLYVAATRAESVLLIADCLNDKGERKENNPWLPLVERAEKNVSEVLGQAAALKPLPDPEELPAETAFTQAAAESLLPAREECSAESYHLLRPSAVKLPSKWAEGEEAATEEALAEDELVENAQAGDALGEDVRAGNTLIEDASEETAGQTAPAANADSAAVNAASALQGRGKKNAALLGTMVHRLLELIVSSRGAIHDADAVLQAMREQEAESAENKALLQQVAATMRKGGYPQTGRVPQVSLEPYTTFWPAEPEHQDFDLNHPEELAEELCR